MAASLLDIASDPNYVNANAATKLAIFEKYSANDPNYANANPATQEAIRAKFGVAAPKVAEAETEGIPGPRGQAPEWAKQYPGVYEAAVKARQLAGPTVEAAGGVLGGALGAGAGAIASPTVVVNPISGGVAGSALGYGMAKEGLALIDKALGLTPQESLPQAATRAAKNVGEGALYEAGGRAVVGPVINKLAEVGAKGAGMVADLNQLPKRLAAKISRESFESPETLAVGQQALKAAAGTDLTAQQALARGGVIAPSTQATIEKSVARTMPAAQAAKETAQEAARKTTLKTITPDLDAAVEARRAASAPLYKAADQAVVPIDAEISAVLTRVPRDVLKNAESIAKMEGRPFIMGEGQNAQITGESLHYVKRALSDMAYGPTAATGIGRDTQLAARGLLNDYVKVFESKVPEYGQARQIFSDLSAPVNQAQVLKEMVSVLEKPGGGERIAPFLNVLGRGENAMLKRAGGRGGPRFESLTEVLTPEQLAKVKEVAKQLETEASIGKQVSAGQQRAVDLIKEELPNYRLPNIFNVLATTTNKVLDVIGARAGKKTTEEIAKASLSAKSFDELLGLMPAEQRIKLLKVMSDPAVWSAVNVSAGKAIMGATAEKPVAPKINALAPENKNNLAPE